MERMTELEALNRMLLGIQLAPMASIDDVDIYSEGMIAKSVLRQVTMDVLIPGWNFNTRRTTLTPDVNGIIHLPANAIDVFATQYDAVDYTIDPDGDLMITDTGVKKFTSPVVASVVLGFPFQDLPIALQSLCLHKARLAFKTEMSTELGGDTQLIMSDIQKAEGLAKAWDTRTKRMSMLDGLGARKHLNRNYPRW